MVSRKTFTNVTYSKYGTIINKPSNEARMSLSNNAKDVVDNDVKQRQKVVTKLKIACCLCASFLIVEVIGGLWSGSLAILSDAAHLMADLASFAVAIGASHLASLPSNSQHTYGLKRTESLAALFSMTSLAVVSVWLAFEALQRGYHIVNKMEDKIVPIDGKLMSSIAAIGVVVNVALALVLGEHHVHMPGGGGHDHDHGGHGHDHDHNHGGHEENSSCIGGAGHDHDHSHEHQNDSATDCDDDDVEGNTKDNGHAHAENGTEVVDKLTGHSYGSIEQSHELPPSKNNANAEETKRNINLHAAYLHVMGDLAQSVAVLIAGLVIWKKPEWRIIDPVVTLLFCTIVLYSTISVLRASISVLLEEVPPTVNWDEIHQGIASVPGVSNVHCLHIWSISHGEPTLSVHASAVDADKALVDINKVCNKFGIHHATLQVQSVFTGVCVTCSAKFDGSCHRVGGGC